VETLRSRENPGDFLRGILADEVAHSQPDAIIFVGARSEIHTLNRSLKDLGGPRCPVVYINYNPDPILNPFRDLIGNLVKLWKGSEYSISSPADLSLVWKDAMSRIVARPAPAEIADPSLATHGLLPKK
jgi:hypothetical protein